MIFPHLDDRALQPAHNADQQAVLPEARPVPHIAIVDGQALAAAGAAATGAEVPLLLVHEPRPLRVFELVWFFNVFVSEPQGGDQAVGVPRPD